jgi:hypothetical protein
MLVGWTTAACWVYIDVTREDTIYNLIQLLGMALIAAIFGPILIGLLIHDRYKGRIAEFFNKPIIGGKK